MEVFNLMMKQMGLMTTILEEGQNRFAYHLQI